MLLDMGVYKCYTSDMVTGKFKLKSRPFSINKAYYKRTFTRTAECRKWGNTISKQLIEKKFSDFCKRFRKAYNSQIHAIQVELTFQYPDSYLFTNSGHVSVRSMDLSNIEKLLIDLLFDKRFNGRQLPTGETVNTLCINDAQIARLISEKKRSNNKQHYINIAISIIPIASL